MAEALRFQENGFSKPQAKTAQRAAKFLNTGDEPRTQEDWRAEHQAHIDALANVQRELVSRAHAGTPSLLKRLSDLTERLQAQVPVVLSAYSLLEAQTLWAEEALAQADNCLKQLFHKHFLAKKLRERHLLDTLEFKLVSAGSTNDPSTFLMTWNELFRAYQNVNERLLLDPCLTRVREMLVEMWTLSITHLTEAAEGLLKTGGVPSQPDRAQLLINQLTSATSRYQALFDAPITDTRYTQITDLIQELKNRLTAPSPKERDSMNREDTQTGLGLASATTDPPSDETTPPNGAASHATLGGLPLPPQPERKTFTDAEHRQMQDLTGALNTPERVRQALTLAKPFFDGTVPPQLPVEQAFFERARNVAKLLVMDVEQMAAGDMTEADARWASANKELILAAYPFFRGEAGTRAVAKIIDWEFLAHKAKKLLASSDDWSEAERSWVNALLNEPLLMGTTIATDLQSRLDRELRSTAEPDTATDLEDEPENPDEDDSRDEVDPAVVELLKQSLKLQTKPLAWTKNDMALADSLLRSPHLPEDARNNLQDRLVRERTRDETKGFNPEPVETPEKNDRSWPNMGWFAVIVMAALVVSFIVGRTLSARRSHPSPSANDAAVSAPPSSTVQAPPTPVTPAPVAQPTAPPPLPASRALVPADFGGNPVNRVPSTYIVQGTWAFQHLRCPPTSPPVTDSNGNTDYGRCQYQP